MDALAVFFGVLGAAVFLVFGALIAAGLLIYFAGRWFFKQGGLGG